MGGNGADEESKDEEEVKRFIEAEVRFERSPSWVAFSARSAVPIARQLGARTEAVSRSDPFSTRMVMVGR